MTDYERGTMPYLAVRIIEGARPMKRELVDFAQWALREHDVAQVARWSVKTSEDFLRASQAGEGLEVLDQLHAINQDARGLLTEIVNDLPDKENS